MANLAPHAYAEDARNPFGSGKNSGDTYTFVLPLATENLTINSEFPLYKCAKDCWVTNPWMQSTDMDSGATLTFDLGYTGTDNAIMSAVSGQTANTNITAVATQVRVPAGSTIFASVKAAPTGASAGTLTVGFQLRNVI